MKNFAQFEQMVHHFWQGSREEYDTHEAWVAGCVSYLDARDRRLALEFVEDLLVRGSEDEMQQAWQAANPDYWIEPAREFFEHLRTELLKQTSG